MIRNFVIRNFVIRNFVMRNFVPVPNELMIFFLQYYHSTGITYSYPLSQWQYKPHCKNFFSIFSSPAGMSLTKLSLGGNNDVINKLYPPRESLVSDIPAEDWNIEKLFLRCSDLVSFVSAQYSVRLMISAEQRK